MVTRISSSTTFVARNQLVMKAWLTVYLSSACPILPLARAKIRQWINTVTASWHVQNHLQSHIVPSPRYRSRLGFFESRTRSTRGPEASKAEQDKHGMGSTSTDSQHLSDSPRRTYSQSGYCSNRRPSAEPVNSYGLSSRVHCFLQQPCGAWPMTSPPAGSNSAIRQPSQWE
ncbi:hypothetical protein GE21DRAFT_1105441 [Neurospora crassa]|nr:hypothetical protein GE21DRAFT_1105441 [Neurospora crassa]